MSERAVKLIKILEDRFGWNCGDTGFEMTCPECARHYIGDEEYCSSCGTKLIQGKEGSSVEQVEIAIRESCD